MIVQIRDAKPFDQVVLHDCDLKCFYVPWSDDFWGEIAKTHVVKVATYWGSIIGFVVATYLEEHRHVMVPKVCVKPNYRRRKVGTQLIDEVEKFARLMKAECIVCTVPESFTSGDQDATGWLKALNFKAVGLLREGATCYGDAEDVIIFNREVK